MCYRKIILFLSLEAYSKLELRLETDYELKIVRCEPIMINIVLKNKGAERERVGIGGMRYLTRLKGFYMMINGKRYIGPWYEYTITYEQDLLGKDYLDREEKILEEIDLRIMGLDEWIYDIWAALELSGNRYNSNKINLEIKVPVGIDLQAYKYAEEYVKRRYPRGNEMEKLKICKRLTENLREDNFILEKYPTSTYAGWAFLNYHFKHNVIDPFKNEELKKEIIKYKDLIIEFLKYNKER